MSLSKMNQTTQLEEPIQRVPFDSIMLDYHSPFDQIETVEYMAR